MQIQFPTFVSFAPYGCLFGSLAIAAVCDLRSRRIPNTITYPTILFAFLMYGLISGWHGLAFSLKGMACGFGFLLIPYLLGGMGAGDVKLMAAVGAVLGTSHTFQAFLVIALLGGAASVAVIIARGEALQTAKRLYMALCCVIGGVGATALQTDRQTLLQKGLPYGVIIACGTAAYVLYVAAFGPGMGSLLPG